MTRTKTNTGKYSGPGKQAQIRMKDFANSFLCTKDPKVFGAMDASMACCMEYLYKAQEDDPAGYAELWTDGSYNKEKKAAGIGIIVRFHGKSPESGHAFGKGVRADSSECAELYAMAIGLSYLLDTYPGIKSVRLRYDCLSASVNAANIDVYTANGAPYTNLRSAMKRARKAGVTVLFQQIKAHAGNQDNETCDLLARYYAKAQLNRDQKKRLAPYILSNRTGTSLRQYPERKDVIQNGTDCTGSTDQ